VGALRVARTRRGASAPLVSTETSCCMHSPAVSARGAFPLMSTVQAALFVPTCCSVSDGAKEEEDGRPEARLWSDPAF